MRCALPTALNDAVAFPIITVVEPGSELPPLSGMAVRLSSLSIYLIRQDCSPLSTSSSQLVIGLSLSKNIVPTPYGSLSSS